MTRTINRLRNYIENEARSPHVHANGRSADYEVPDHVSEGFALMAEDADLCAVSDIAEGDRQSPTTSEDVGVS